MMITMLSDVVQGAPKIGRTTSCQ